jgi:hypothetical protein
MDRLGRQAQQTSRDVGTLKNIAIGAVVAKGVSMAADAFLSAGRAARCPMPLMLLSPLMP